jgi:L-ascorbate metabolism protein UlaG (beta-lactamase superfamily)
MLSWGIDASRIVATTPELQQLAENISVKSLPSAHPKVRMGSDNQPVAVGYLINLNDCQIYLAGDTSACEDVIAAIKKQPHIDIALLPVNEDNFFRRKRGIVGNMSIREAFGLAAECGISTVVPVHWDLFEANSTDPEEIKAVYQAHAWPFRLAMSIEEALI